MTRKDLNMILQSIDADRERRNRKQDASLLNTKPRDDYEYSEIIPQAMSKPTRIAVSI